MVEGIVAEMAELERIADRLSKQRYSQLGGSDPLQAEYSKAISETLNAISRLASQVATTEDKA